MHADVRWFMVAVLIVMVMVMVMVMTMVMAMVVHVFPLMPAVRVRRRRREYREPSRDGAGTHQCRDRCGRSALIVSAVRVATGPV